jgi:hypothetical protein
MSFDNASLVTDEALDDINGRYDVNPLASSTFAPTMRTSSSPWITGNWTDNFSQNGKSFLYVNAVIVKYFRSESHRFRLFTFQR